MMRQLFLVALLAVALPALAEDEVKPLALRVHEAVEKVAPIEGVSLDDEKVKTTWKIHFRKEATEQQKTEAKAAIEAFTP